MTPYVIRRGDHLSRLAHRMGFDADTVWNHPKNADLRKLRADPHILCSGDVLYVPPRAREWLPVAVGKVNQFVVPIRTMPFSVTLLRDGKPVGGQDCVIQELPPPNRFTTDANGTLSLRIPVSVESLTVEFSALALVQRLNVGHLDPSNTPSGVAQRLRNLGYRATDENASVGSAALAQFQHDAGLPVTGVIDDDTRLQLESRHGC